MVRRAHQAALRKETPSVVPAGGLGLSPAHLRLSEAIPRQGGHFSQTIISRIPVYLDARQESARRVAERLCGQPLEPPNQAEFESQLNEILLAVKSMETIRLVPNIGPGTQVLIRRGPLEGIEAWVEDREGPREVLLGWILLAKQQPLPWQ